MGASRNLVKVFGIFLFLSTMGRAWTVWGFTSSDCEKTQRGIMHSLDRNAYQKNVRAYIEAQVDALIHGRSATVMTKRLKIEVMVDSNRNVVTVNILQSSGDEVFDRSLLEAVKKASPLPAPPCRVAEEVFKEGFLFEF